MSDHFLYHAFILCSKRFQRIHPALHLNKQRNTVRDRITGDFRKPDSILHFSTHFFFKKLFPFFCFFSCHGQTFLPGCQDFPDFPILLKRMDYNLRAHPGLQKRMIKIDPFLMISCIHITIRQQFIHPVLHPQYLLRNLLQLLFIFRGIGSPIFSHLFIFRDRIFVLIKVKTSVLNHLADLSRCMGFQQPVQFPLVFNLWHRLTSLFCIRIGLFSKKRFKRLT